LARDAQNWRAIENAKPQWRPNKPIQPTPLCSPKIVGILKSDLMPSAVPI
jgi:hypothetical protein